MTSSAPPDEDFGRPSKLSARSLLLAEERTRFAGGGGVDVEVDAQLMHFI
jgi:hypothetical protein